MSASANTARVSLSLCKHFPCFNLWFAEIDSPLVGILGHHPVNSFHGLIKYTTNATNPC